MFQQFTHGDVELRVAADQGFADWARRFDVDGARVALHVGAVVRGDLYEWQTKACAVDQWLVRSVDDPTSRRLADHLAQAQASITFGEVFSV